MTASFQVTDAEMDLIERIVDRAIQQGYVAGRKQPGHWYQPTTAIMDLCACHANGTPLDFERLLAADDYTFIHDIGGIARHMNRETGMLGGCFLPRTAKKEAA